MIIKKLAINNANRFDRFRLLELGNLILRGRRENKKSPPALNLCTGGDDYS